MCLQSRMPARANRIGTREPNEDELPMSTALARLEMVSVRMRDLAMVGIGIAIIPRSFVSLDRTCRDLRCYSRVISKSIPRCFKSRYYNLGITLPILSISDSYLRTIEPLISIISLTIGNSRLQPKKRYDAGQND